MPVDADVAFRFMRANYQAGMLDKTGMLAGEALEAWMTEEGLDLEDLLTTLDSASEQTVARLNRLVRFANPILRAGSNRRMLRLQSRLLDNPRLRTLFVFATKRLLHRAFPRPKHENAAHDLLAGGDRL